MKLKTIDPSWVWALALMILLFKSPRRCERLDCRAAGLPHHAHGAPVTNHRGKDAESGSWSLPMLRGTADTKRRWCVAAIPPHSFYLENAMFLHIWKETGL